jgi:cell division septum initiation protein DivIVA
MSLTKINKLKADNQKFQDEFNALQNQLQEANIMVRSLQAQLEDSEHQKLEFQDMVHTSQKMLTKERKEKEQLVENELNAKLELERQIEKLQFEMIKYE